MWVEGDDLRIHFYRVLFRTQFIAFSGWTWLKITMFVGRWAAFFLFFHPFFQLHGMTFFFKHWNCCYANQTGTISNSISPGPGQPVPFCGYLWGPSFLLSCDLVGAAVNFLCSLHLRQYHRYFIAWLFLNPGGRAPPRVTPLARPLGSELVLSGLHSPVPLPDSMFLGWFASNLGMEARPP